MNHTPFSSAKTRDGKSCGGTKVIPAQARTSQEAKPEARVPSTAPSRVSALMQVLCRASAARARFYRKTARLGALIGVLLLTALPSRAGSPGQPTLSAAFAGAFGESALPTRERVPVTLGGAWPAILADFPAPTLTFAEIGMFFVAIFGFAVFWSQLRKMEDRIGAKAAEVAVAKVGEGNARHETHIADQPLQVQGVVRFVAQHELDERLDSYVTTEVLRDTERRIEGKLEENFRALDTKRGHSIGNLHEHLTGTTKSLTEKIAEGDAKTHDRIEAMSNTLRAEFEAKLQTVREDITDLPGRLLTLLQQTGQIGQGGKR